MDSTTLAGNLLLNTLSPETLASLAPAVEEHGITERLYSHDEKPEHVFFPIDGAICSVVRVTDDGGSVEAGVVGDEGVVSIHSIIATATPLGTELVVQTAGKFARVRAKVAREVFRRDTKLRDAVLTYTSSFLMQITQHSVCNRLHPIEARLSKWLLSVADRARSTELQLTHEFISHMLGTHRPGVSVAIRALELDGLIDHSRNRVAIRSREGLIARACECFDVLHRSLDDLRGALAR